MRVGLLVLLFLSPIILAQSYGKKGVQILLNIDLYTKPVSPEGDFGGCRKRPCQDFITTTESTRTVNSTKTKRITTTTTAKPATLHTFSKQQELAIYIVVGSITAVLMAVIVAALVVMYRKKSERTRPLFDLPEAVQSECEMNVTYNIYEPGPRPGPCTIEREGPRGLKDHVYESVDNIYATSKNAPTITENDLYESSAKK